MLKTMVHLLQALTWFTTPKMSLLKQLHLLHPSHSVGMTVVQTLDGEPMLLFYGSTMTFTTSLNFRFLDDNKDDCWLSTYYGLNDDCSNPDDANNFGDYGYNQMEVEYYTDLQVDYQIQ